MVGLHGLAHRVYILYDTVYQRSNNEACQPDVVIHDFCPDSEN